MIYSLGQKTPQIAPSTFIAPSADVIGAVQLGEDTSVWHQAVLRGDNDQISVGSASNIQDGVIIHVDPGFPCTIGERCVIGHRAVLHGCTIGNEVLIGIGAVILNGAQIPDGCLIGAGALVAAGKELEEGHLYLGAPAKKIRALTSEERAGIVRNTEGYKKRASLYEETATALNPKIDTF